MSICRIYVRRCVSSILLLCFYGDKFVDQSMGERLENKESLYLFSQQGRQSNVTVYSSVNSKATLLQRSKTKLLSMS